MTEQQFYSVLNSSMPDYTPIEKLGAGNFGSVYKCERDGIYYAIKIIPVPSNDDELQMLLARSGREEVQEYLTEKVESYRREIRLMAELKGNRNIVTIEDYKIVEAENGIGYYIVIRMELLTSLVRHMSKNDPSREEIIRLGIDICDALSICEKHGVVHRDIKPENIMIHNDGAYKLGDFGIAKQLSKTTTGSVAGTEGFMAPEVCHAMEYNHTADIYSLGILLYYYLNNRKMPFVAPDNKSIIAEQQAIARKMTACEVLPFPSSAADDLGKVVVKACMYDKACRYQSADEMRADLVRVMNGEPVEIDLTAEAPLMVNVGNGTKHKTPEASPFSGSMLTPRSSKRKNTTQPTQPTQEIAPKNKGMKKWGLVIGASVVLICIAVGTLLLINYVNDQPTTYIDANGNELQTLSRNEMAAAYELGLKYYEQGSYENAITELSKVTDKSSRYEAAQSVKSQAMAAYATKLIEQSSAYLESGSYETALGLVESGMALMGDDANLYGQVQSILNALKLDMVNQATDAEKNEKYAEAFSYIQVAAAFLPDDMEIQTIYVRLEAMAVAEAALADAERYMDGENYEMTFAVLGDALKKVADTQTAASKITLVYDEYKKEYLSDVEKLARKAKNSLKFQDAIEALKTAIAVFPDEYDLQTLHDELVDLDVAHTAVDKVADLSSKSDYENLFKALRAAMNSISSSTEAKKLVEECYETHKEEFMTRLNEQIGEPKTIAEYDEAIEAVKTAIKVFGSDAELEARVSTLEENKPIDLFTLSFIDAKYYELLWAKDWVGINDDGCDYLLFNEATKDNYGNKYDYATIMRIKQYNASGWFGNKCVYLTYNCANYAQLSGVLAIAEETKSSIKTCTFSIMGITADGKEKTIYEEEFTSSVAPQEFTIDVSSYSLIKIEFKSDKTSEDEMQLILSDFSLSK